MEETAATRHIAVIENCVMSAVGLQHIFALPAFSSYQVHLFSRFDSFKEALSQTAFYSVIYSLSDAREERRNCLASLRDLMFSHGNIQRIVLASDDVEARLICHLSPARLHGIISKSVSLEQLIQGIVTFLNETHRVNDNMYNHWYVNQNRMLSPTERAILRYMSSGYSIPEIATQLERNIKTIRAHKFNAMVKLGVNSDVGLLDAADILAHLPAREPRRPALSVPSFS
ncbi:helix-turn-helix transcriptional regulator [Enterobacter cloacae]|nr:helix-turn-helix transcriptional regulator [Enterobacter cloacae]